MPLNDAAQVSTGLLMHILDSALRTLVLASGTGLGLAMFRVKAASVRLFTWTAVLGASLALPLLGWMLPPLAIPTPAFLHSGEAQLIGTMGKKPLSSESKSTALAPRVEPVAQGNEAKASSARDHERSNRAQSIAAMPTATHIRSSLSISWSAAATAIYFVVALILFIRLIVGFIFSRRLLRSSPSIREARLTARLASGARHYGIACAPRAAESELISVPVTMGAMRSTILLPSSWREWDETKLDAVIAHEMSHVARRDALTQRLSLLHRAIFWFSPLAWWLDRRLAELAEQASDEAALSSGTDRADYARTLLGFIEASQAALGRVQWQGVSMAKAGQAEKRMERILAWKGSVTMNLKKPIAVMIVALAIPVVYLTASVRPSTPGQNSRDPQPAPTPSAQMPAPGVPSELPPPPEPRIPPDSVSVPPRISGSGSAEIRTVETHAAPPAAVDAPTVSAYSPNPIVAPVASIFPPAMWSRQSNGSSSQGAGYSYHYGYDDDERFVIVTGKSDSLTMSGSTQDARHVEKLRKQIPGDFIWFQRDEESYIIRDQATVDRARKLWAPQEELGRKQEELGKQQEALGRQQEALSKRMEEVRVKVPDMTAELDKLKTELQKLGSTASMEQIGNLQSEIGELQSKIGNIQSHAGEQQGKLGEEQGALGEKQGKLGEQQGELGRQQGELAEKASHEMKQLLDEAVAKGTAQPEAKTLKAPTL